MNLDAVYGATISATALRAGSRAAAQALSTLDAAMMRRLQPLAARPRSELAGADYLDSSVLDYAMCKALEAAFPEANGVPPAPLARESFVLCISEVNPGAVAEISPANAEQLRDGAPVTIYRYVEFTGAGNLSHC